VAVQHGQLEMVQILLEKGALPNLTIHANGAAPLHLAIQNGQIEIVKLLLEKGADPNQSLNDGSTPRLIAKQVGNNQIIDLLTNATQNKSNKNIRLSNNDNTFYNRTADNNSVKRKIDQVLNPNPDQRPSKKRTISEHVNTGQVKLN
jgi:ankyrin repeat protein